MIAIVLGNVSKSATKLFSFHSRTFSSIGPLETSQVEQWRHSGYTVVSNLLEGGLIEESERLMADPNRKHNWDFGSDGEFEFPTGHVIDQITVHEQLIGAVKQLLGEEEVLLTQSDAWLKAGSKDNNPQSNKNQRFHMDYGNHTFLHPPEWRQPEAVAAIVYLSDIEKTGGGTAVVERTGPEDQLYQPPYINMPGQAGHPFINDRDHCETYFAENFPEVARFREKLYQRQVIPDYSKGDVLFYRYDTWHRGTPVHPNQVRCVMNLAWKKKQAHWFGVWNPGWATKNYYGVSEKLFTQMSPVQRATVGVPLPGDPYWDERKLGYLQARYPSIDIKPYLEKLDYD